MAPLRSFALRMKIQVCAGILLAAVLYTAIPDFNAILFVLGWLVSMLIQYGCERKI